MARNARNKLCPCGSGRKYKACCLKRCEPAGGDGPLRARKIADVGTSHPAVARLIVGLFEVLDMSDLDSSVAERVKDTAFRLTLDVVDAEKCYRGIIGRMEALTSPIRKGHRENVAKIEARALAGARQFAEKMRSAVKLTFEAVGAIWSQNFLPTDCETVEAFFRRRLGIDHTLPLTIASSRAMLDAILRFPELTDRQLIGHLVRPTRTMKAGRSGGAAKAPARALRDTSIDTLLEEIVCFAEALLYHSTSAFLDDRLTLYPVSEDYRTPDYPVRYRVGTKPGVRIKDLEDHPKLRRIYRSGQRAYHQRELPRKDRYGEVRPLIHADFQGKKVIAVGKTLYLGDWVTFVDFLLYFLPMKLGRDWWQAELARSPNERSPVVQWYERALPRLQNPLSIIGNICSAVPSGPLHAYLRLAYDLFVLEDHQQLQGRLLKRLRFPRTDSFYGAQYEALVTATLIRAGFTIEPEPETDGSRRHPEFVATDIASGQRVSVEAKRRNRPPRESTRKDARLGVGNLLLDAAGKVGNLPCVVFVELDLPPSGDPRTAPWFNQLAASHEQAELRDAHGRNVFNMIVFTNYPVENPKAPELVPAQQAVCSIAANPKVPLCDETLRRIRLALETIGRLPVWFDE